MTEDEITQHMLQQNYTIIAWGSTEKGKKVR